MKSQQEHKVRLCSSIVLFSHTPRATSSSSLAYSLPNLVFHFSNCIGGYPAIQHFGSLTSESWSSFPVPHMSISSFFNSCIEFPMVCTQHFENTLRRLIPFLPDFINLINWRKPWYVMNPFSVMNSLLTYASKPGSDTVCSVGAWRK